MIKTKIARILSPTRFVLAAGKEQGVEEGMEFIIYELSDPIYDPESGESLGELELHKGRVRVVHVQDKLSTAATLMRKKYRASLSELLLGISRPSSVLTHPGEWIDEREELPVEQGTATATEVDLTVKVGDLVRSVS